MISIAPVSGTILFIMYIFVHQKNRDNTDTNDFHGIQSAQCAVGDKDDTSVNACFETKLQSMHACVCYVFPMEGASCMVTTVDSLVVLNCSMWFPSTLLISTLGSWKPFSEGGFELTMLPDTELTGMVFRGMLLWIVDCDSFGRGLEPLLAPRTLDACVRLVKRRTWC